MARELQPYLTFTGVTNASDDTYFEAGKNGAIVSVLNSIGGEVEIHELKGVSVYESITDPNDSIDVSKKVLNSALTSRTITPGFKGAFSSTSAASIFIKQII